MTAIGHSGLTAPRAALAVTASLAMLLLLLVASPPVSAATTPTTKLAFLAVIPGDGRAVFHLSCGPPGGDLPDPVAACATLAAAPSLVATPRGDVCFGGYPSEITISGRLNGQPIRRRFWDCSPAQTATFRRLGMSRVLRKHLLPRRHETVLFGTNRVFAPGVLKPADLVSCDLLGHTLTVGVPIHPGPSGVSSAVRATLLQLYLTLAYRRDGSVSARCYTE